MWHSGSPRRVWDLPDRRGSSLSHRSNSAATIAADFSWRAFTRISGSWPRMSASISHSPAMVVTVWVTRREPSLT